MTPPPPLSADLLLEHRGFLTGLARSLVVDEQHAEDVVQEVYLAALRRPPPASAGLRAWLSGVTRNLALRRRRGEGRLRRRETQAARRESRDATVDVAARVEAQRLIADAVAALDEPGRSAIVWRYFDGLPPREIAKRQGVSVRTIESRLRRARETLRARLDDSFGGTRETWCALLLPIVGADLPAHLSSSAAAAAAASSATGTAHAAGGLALATAGATIVSTKILVTAAAVCVGAAFFVGRETAPPAPPAVVTAPDTEPADPDAGPQLAARDLSEKVAAQERALNELRAEYDALRTEHAALERQVAESRPAGGAPSAEGAAGGPAERFAADRYKKAVSGIQWEEAGEAASKMLPLLSDLVLAMSKGKKVPDDIGIQIFQQNQKLQRVAVAAVSSELPGTGGNGAFTHPAVTLNLIVSTLAQAGAPLDERQIEKLYEIGDRFLAEDERRRTGYSEDTLQTQKTLEECDLKDRMYAEVDNLLTEQQRTLLHPEPVRGRLGVDIFSSGVIYYTLGKPVDFSTREDLAEGLVSKYLAKAHLSETEVAALRIAAKEWADGFSEATLRAGGEKLIRDSRAQSGGMLAGWMKTTTAREAAVRQLELNRVLYDLVQGDAEKMAAVRGDATIYIPLQRP